MIRGYATITITDLGRERGWCESTRDLRGGTYTCRRFDPGTETEIELRIRVSADSNPSDAVEALTEAVRQIGFRFE